MSTARVYTVQKSRASKRGPRSCEKCHVAIPVGDSYRYFEVGFRSSYQHVRCMKTSCTPKMSELESSRLSEVYSAIETAQDSLDSSTEPGEVSDVESIVTEVADAITEVADAYREADEAFGGGGNTDNAQRADDLESASDDLQGFSFTGDEEPDYDQCENDLHEVKLGHGHQHLDKGDESCESCMEIKQEWWESVLQEARDALDNVSI